MSVEFARAYVEGMRRHGIRVDLHPGWERRGNGQTSRYDGIITHHTGAAFDGGFWVLVDGRADLRGPLCNVCTWADGHQTLIAAHPANHAGAAGGSWARPFPDTRNFNPMVWGNEIMYPGAQPMTLAQYRTALIGAGVVCGILRKPNPEWARLHMETSVSGKWDPGYAPGKTIDRHRFRADIWPALHSPPPEEDDMFTDHDRALLEKVHYEATLFLPNRRLPGHDKDADTVLGYAASAEGRAARLESSTVVLGERLYAVETAVQEIRDLLKSHIGGEAPKA